LGSVTIRTPSSTTILLVEDDKGFRPILTNYLVSLGAKVIECRNFFQAKEQMARESASLVLTDLQLPDGDGFKLMAEVRKHQSASDRNVPVIAMMLRPAVFFSKHRAQCENESFKPGKAAARRVDAVGKAT